MPLPSAVDRSESVQFAERINVLDILRGIALLGMFFVHFSDYSTDPGGGFGHFYKRAVELLFSGRFYTMFAILFGVGFAVQLRRAEVRRDAFVPRYVRRILALAVFGFIAEAFFGFSVLLGYAIWGAPLLLVRRWSTKALVVTILLCTASTSLYWVTRMTYATAVGTTREQFGVDVRAGIERGRAMQLAQREAVRSTDYRTVVAGRIRHMPWFYSQEFSFLPHNLALFLIGLLGVRLGLFDDPRRHWRLITGMMIFGAVSWALSEWVLPHGAVPADWPRVIRVWFRGQFTGEAFLLGGQWLAFTYIGAILLLVAHSPAWVRRLGAFGATGRMALTNYMLQIMIIDVTFRNYGFGLHLSAAYAPLAALALFVVDVALCRWWLSSYQYGPLEWLWRSATYAHWQPMRRAPTIGGG